MGENARGDVSDSRPERIGRFEIVRQLGRGGQGTVYLATDPELGRQVALKVLTTVDADSARVRERFRREAALASRVDHPGLCQVYEGAWDASVPYIAMRYVEGASVASLLEQQRRGVARTGPLGRPQTTLALFEAVARAIHAAHEAGIVHRDIKPANIVVQEDGQPVLLDFGLALAEDAGVADRTRSTGLRGTPAYLSPEQIAGDDQPDRRTDVYALGVSLFEALTGRLPFEAADREALYRAIIEDEPPAIRSLERSVPRDLQAVIETSMEKNRDRRYRTALEFADDLRRVLDHQPVHATGVPAPLRLARWVRRRPAFASFLVLLTVTLAVLGGLLGRIIVELPELEAWEAEQARGRAERFVEKAFVSLFDGRTADVKTALEAAGSAHGLDVESIGAHVLALGQERRWRAAIDVLTAHSELVGQSPSLQHLQAIARARAAGSFEDPPSREVPAPETVADLFVMGMHELLRGRARAARGHLLRAVYTHRKAPRLLLHAFLTIAAVRSGDVDTARAFGASCEQLWPDRFLARWAQGAALAVLEGFGQEAVDALRTAVSLEPRSRGAVTELARLLLRTGRADEAERLLRDKVSRWPESVAWRIELARMHLARGATDRVEDLLGAADEARALVLLGRARALRKEPELAREAFARAAQLDPASPAARAGMVAALVRIDPNRVEAEHEGNLARTGPPTWCLEYGLELRSAGCVEEAAQALETAAARTPTRAVATRSLAELAEARGDRDTALEHARMAVTLDPGDPESWRLLGRFAYARNDWRGAVEAWERATRLEPGWPLTFSNLGRALQLLDLQEEAHKAFLEATRLAPLDDGVLRNFANFLLTVDRPRELITLCERVLESHPDHLNALFNLARARRVLGQIPEADDAWSRVLEVASPDLAWIHVRHARYLAVTDRPEAAISACRRAIGIDADEPTGYLTLAWAMLGADRRGEAVAAAERALALRPDDPAIRTNVGSTLIRAGRRDRALELLQETVRRFPEHHTAWRELGRTFEAMGRLDDAVDALWEGAEAAPQNLTVHRYLVRVLEASRRFEEATTVWRAMLALRSDAPWIHAGLARALLREDDAEGALHVLRSAVEDFPEARQVHEAMVAALRITGDRQRLDAERARWSRLETRERSGERR